MRWIELRDELDARLAEYTQFTSVPSKVAPLELAETDGRRKELMHVLHRLQIMEDSIQELLGNTKENP